MAIKLNLLPPELAVDKKLGAVLKTTRVVGTILLGAFLIFVLGLSAFFVISSVLLRNTIARVDNLKDQIVARETSEQQMVLLKDRLKKISSVRAIPTSFENLSAIDPFLLSLSPDSAVTELDVDPIKIGLLINFKTTSDLTSFFENLATSDVFKSATLSSFGFNPLAGYLAGLSVVPK